MTLLFVLHDLKARWDRWHWRRHGRHSHPPLTIETGPEAPLSARVLYRMLSQVAARLAEEEEDALRATHSRDPLFVTQTPTPVLPWLTVPPRGGQEWASGLDRDLPRIVDPAPITDRALAVRPRDENTERTVPLLASRARLARYVTEQRGVTR